MDRTDDHTHALRPRVAADLAGGLGAALLLMFPVALLIMAVEPNAINVPVFYALWCLSTASFVSVAQLGRPGRRYSLILACAALSAGAPSALAVAAWSVATTGLVAMRAPSDHEVSFLVLVAGTSVLRFAAWLAIAGRRSEPRPRAELLLLAALLPGAFAVAFVGLIGVSHGALSRFAGPVTQDEAVSDATAGFVLGLVLYGAEAFAFWLTRAGALGCIALVRWTRRAPPADDHLRATGIPISRSM